MRVSPSCICLRSLRSRDAERLVEEEHGRLVDQGARQGHALLLATGQLRGTTLANPVERHELQRSRHALADLARRRSLHPEPEGDIVGHRHVGKERIALEDRVHRAPMRRRADHPAALDEDVAGVRLGETRR